MWIERGEGGSLILHTVAVCVGGVSLVLVPLLVMTANQLSRIKSASQRHGSVRAVHLDEVTDSLVRSSLLPKMAAMDKGGADTLLLYCSPQYLATRGWFRASILRCHARGMLRLVAVDEAHIHAMHG